MDEMPCSIIIPTATQTDMSIYDPSQCKTNKNEHNKCPHPEILLQNQTKRVIVNIIAVGMDRLSSQNIRVCMCFQPRGETSAWTERGLLGGVHLMLDQRHCVTTRLGYAVGLGTCPLPDVYTHMLASGTVEEADAWFTLLHFVASPNLPSTTVGTLTALFRRKTVPFLRTVCVGTSPLAICRS